VDQSIVLLGMGGHAKVLLDSMRECGMTVRGFINPVNTDAPDGVEYLGDDERFRSDYSPSSVDLVNGLGSVRNTQARGDIFNQFKACGYRFASVIHPSAVISSTARLGEGVQVMAGVVIQTGVRCGDNVLMNTRSMIDHDCRVGTHSHIASGSVVSGNVNVGENVHVGAGSTIIQGINIGEASVIAAGAVVICDVPECTTVAGVPAHRIEK